MSIIAFPGAVDAYNLDKYRSHGGFGVQAVSDHEAARAGGGILRGACLLTLLLPISATASEALRNGGFETGDLSGWTPDGPAGSSVTVVSSFFHYGEHAPKEGSRFALLKSPRAPTASTTLTQSFHAKAGSVISGWAIFRSGAFALPPYQWYATYKIVLRDNSRERSVLLTSNKSTGWEAWNWVVPTDGNYILVATVNGGAYGSTDVDTSYLGLDGITITSPADAKAPVVTPPQDIHVEIPAREKTVPATHTAIAAFLNAATANDDRDGAVTGKAVNPPTSFPAGDTTVTFEAVDAAGNRGSATARVTVVQALITVADSPVEAEAPKPAGTPPAPPSPPPTEPVPPATPTATVVKAPDGTVTWTFRGEIVEHEVDYHTFTANKDWLYVFEIGDGKAPAQWIRVDPGGTHAPREDTSYVDKTRRRFAWVPPETKDYRVQVWAAKGPYVLTVTGRADDHGNDWQHATPVSLGQTVPGEIWEVPGNVDVFSFHGKKGGIYRIETQQPENPRAHLRVYDRKPGGATREDFTWAKKPSRSVTFRTPRDDTYYVQVWGGVGKYSLRITRLK